MNAPITKLIIGALSIMLSVAFGYLAIAYSHLPFNSAGRYFDAGTGIVFHEQAIIVFILAGLTFFFAATIIFFRLWKHHHQK